MIAAYMGGLGPGPCATHLSMNRPCTWHQLYSEVEKFSVADKDHRRRVAQKNLMRKANQQPGMNHPRPPFHQHSAPNFRSSYPVHTIEGGQEPSRDNEGPNQGGFQGSSFKNSSRGRGRNTRGKDRGRGRGAADDQPHEYFCAFHGEGSDHGTTRCPETLKTK